MTQIKLNQIALILLLQLGLIQSQFAFAGNRGSLRQLLFAAFVAATQAQYYGVCGNTESACCGCDTNSVTSNYIVCNGIGGTPQPPPYA